MFEFSIHCNPQRLKHASRGLLASVLLKSSRYGSLNGIREITSRRQRLSSPPIDDHRRNLTTKSFFSVITKHTFERLFIRSIHKLSDGLARRHIEPHIERCIERISEASCGIRELIRRKSQIEQDAIDRFNPQFLQRRARLRVTRLLQEPPLATNFLRREPKHEWVSIEPNQSALGSDALRNLATMATCPDGSIKHGKSWLQFQLLQDLTKHDRNMA